MRANITLICDACGKEKGCVPIQITSAEDGFSCAEDEMLHLGWEIRPGGRHICSTCAARENALRRKIERTVRLILSDPQLCFMACLSVALLLGLFLSVVFL